MNSLVLNFSKTPIWAKQICTLAQRPSLHNCSGQTMQELIGKGLNISPEYSLFEV